MVYEHRRESLGLLYGYESGFDLIQFNSTPFLANSIRLKTKFQDSITFLRREKVKKPDIWIKKFKLLFYFGAKGLLRCHCK